MDTNTIIYELENKWLNILFKYIKNKFKNLKLSSHDHTHHLRVWLNAKQILSKLSETWYKFTQNEIEELIFAVFFHDVGMTKTIDFKHGIYSKQIFEDFINKNKIDLSCDVNEISRAIQMHDDKNYLDKLNKNIKFNIIEILSLSDDIDAFSYIGVFRYFEIYYLRNVNVIEIANKVLLNLEARFNNFTHKLYKFKSLINTQTNRYNTTKNFFIDMNTQLKNEVYSIETNYGAFGVINSFITYIINSDKNIYELCDLKINNSTDKYTKEFFINLKNELL